MRIRVLLPLVAGFVLTLAACPDNKAPLLGVSLTNISLSASPFQGTFVISNTGTKVLTWSVASSSAWLTVTPASGVVAVGAQATVTASVATTGLPNGTSTGVLTVTSDGGTSVVTVSVSLTPQLSVSATTMAIKTASAQSTFTISNTGTGTLTWSLTSNSAWLTATPSSGTVAAGQTTTVTAQASLSGIACSTCSGTLSVTSDGGAASVAVSMRVVTLRITNFLLNALNLYTNGVAQGSIPAQSTGVATQVGGDSLIVRLGLVRTMVGTTPIGDSITVTYTTLMSPAGTYTDTLANVIGSTYLFAPYVTNNTSSRLLMTVNAGTTSENKCNCLVSALSSQVGLGYYVYVSGGQVRGYREGSSYTGNYIYWTFTTANLTTGTGRVDLIANTAPTAEQPGTVAGQVTTPAAAPRAAPASNWRLVPGAPAEDRALPPLPAVRRANVQEIRNPN